MAAPGVTMSVAAAGTGAMDGEYESKLVSRVPELALAGGSAAGADFFYLVLKS
jgi:hypothetical protein